MLSGWSTKRVLIVVKTYPTPAHKGVEVSCTAGVTWEREWIRLFPVPFRFLEQDRQFSRYQWIDVQARRARNDQRPESHNLNEDHQIGAGLGRKGANPFSASAPINVPN